MAQALVQLFDEVRLLEHQLVRTVEVLHADLAVTAPRRAVLEYLHRHGPSTVPDIARARLVTRQHIQVLADGLLADGLVARTPNPAHQRSPLLALTGDGAALITLLLEREQQFLRRQLGGIDPAAVTAAAQVLAAVRAGLDQEVEPWP